MASSRPDGGTDGGQTGAVADTGPGELAALVAAGGTSVLLGVAILLVAGRQRLRRH